MDDTKVDAGELCFAPESSFNALSYEATQPSALREGEWTEARMRELLSESLGQSVLKSIDEHRAQSAQRSQSRVRESREKLYWAVIRADSAEIVRIMCELTPRELEEVVPEVSKTLKQEGLSSVDVRCDDFHRVVLFDEEKGRGVAMAPSGSYQRVSKFYDGSYRYGIELLLDDDSMKESVEALFAKIRGQIVCV